MSKEGLISVIMPAYNCEKYVKIAIDSVLNQTYTDFELLIADDCSTDSTRKIIDEYKDARIKCFHNSENLGYLKACNNLASHASGTFLTFLDSDDINAPDRLEKQIFFLKNNPEISCVGSNIIGIDSEGNETKRTNFPNDHNTIVKVFENYNVPCHYSSLLIRKEVIEKIGLYNEYFNRIGSEDIYWFSFVIMQFKVANLPEHLYYYRKHLGSVTANHKSPKAFVGYHLSLFFYKRRKNNESDFINENKWEMADDCANYLLAITSVKKSFWSGFGKFMKAFIKKPQFFLIFYREFLSNLRAGLKR